MLRLEVFGACKITGSTLWVELSIRDIIWFEVCKSKTDISIVIWIGRKEGTDIFQDYPSFTRGKFILWFFHINGRITDACKKAPPSFKYGHQWSGRDRDSYVDTVRQGQTVYHLIVGHNTTHNSSEDCASRFREELKKTVEKTCIKKTWKEGLDPQSNIKENNPAEASVGMHEPHQIGPSTPIQSIAYDIGHTQISRNGWYVLFVLGRKCR